VGARLKIALNTNAIVAIVSEVFIAALLSLMIPEGSQNVSSRTSMKQYETDPMDRAL
jgi:hypothetical protein